MIKTAENELTVQIADDFNLQMIAESGQCFRWNKTADGGYRILHADRCLYIRQTGETEYCLDCGEDEFNSIWKSYFDLDENYAGIRERIDRCRDPFLYQAAQEQKEILFHIVIQEFSASRTAEIMGKTDRNIRKVRLTIISKICRTYSDLTGLEKRLKEDPSARLTEHERYVLSVLNMNIGAMRGNQKKSNSGKKKGKKKNRPGRSGSK